MDDPKKDEMQNRLAAAVRFFADEIGQRSYRDLPQLDVASDYLLTTFASLGCRVESQPFMYRGTGYRNIIAEVPGAENDDEVLVVGAHYDTAEGTPGADDNASGLACLLELARMTAASPAKRTVRFAAFCLEEPPAFMTRNMGSYIYARSLEDERRKILGMVSLEMVGYFKDDEGTQYYPSSLFKLFYPRRGNFIAFVGNLSSRRFTEGFCRTFRSVSSFPVESLHGISFIPGVDFSDHRNFWKFGIPAFMVTDTAFYRNPNYHGPGDRPETLDYDRMADLTYGLAKTVAAI